MEHKHYTRMGTFVAIGLLVFVVTVFFIGSDSRIFSSSYELVTELDQVQGLTEGSLVSLSGLKAGSVEKLEILDGGIKVRATLSIYEEFQGRITSSSRVQLKTQGALGDRYVFISPGEPGETPLQEGDTIIATKSSDILDLISEQGPRIANISEVIEQMRILLTDINEKNRGKELMKSLVGASSNVDTLAKEATGLITDLRGEDRKQINDSLKHLKQILAKIDNGDGTLGALINDPSLFNRITDLLGQPDRNRYLKPLIRTTIKAQDKN